jgi:superfamily II DNA/RNA helicase
MSLGFPAFARPIELTRRRPVPYRSAQIQRFTRPERDRSKPAKDVRQLSSDEQTIQEPLSFSSLGLSPKVLSAVTDAGYTVPTPIQAGAIPHALEGKDILGIAQTGTGKTASFVLPMLTRLEKGRARARMPRTLILEPTRELAAQVEENFIRYGKNHKLNIALLIGGVSFEDQNRKLERGADVLIATPGRMLDHFERGKLLLTGVEILVIDEADRMLDMGFIPDIERICKLIPFTRQTLFFSATMPPEITKLTEQFLHSPVRVEVSRAATTAVGVTQRLVKSASKGWDKRETLRRLIREEGDAIKNAIIFCNRKVEVADLFRSLIKHDFNAGALHGDMDQRARMTMLANFRDGKLKLLVASDVAARGLDIPDVSHIFNFDVPIHAEDYVHRIGRTARAGRSGKSFTLVTRADMRYVDAIEKLIGQKIEWHDGDLSTVVASEEDETPRRGRGKERAGRGRKGDDKKERGERKPRAARPAEPEAAAPMQEIEPVAAAAPERRSRKDAIRSKNAERQHKGERTDRMERVDRPRSDGRHERPDRTAQNRRQREADDDGTVGFGNDMPAFMRVTAKV